MSLNHTAQDLETRYAGGFESPGFPRIAEALLREGRMEEAIRLAEQGLHRHPGSLTGYLVLGRCLQQAGRLDEAKSQFESALKIDTRCPSARYHLAQIAERLQWKSVALEHYRVLCEIEPWDEAARENYGRMLREAPGTQPAPKLAPRTTAENPASAGDLAAAGLFAGAPTLPEYRLDEVADFLPTDQGMDVDLANSLPTASEWDIPALPETGKASSVVAAPASDSVREPSPLDLLRDEGDGGDASATQNFHEPAPFSGDDVGNRLDDIFGLAKDASPMPQPESQETGAASISSINSIPAADATTYARAAETGYLDGRNPVDGDDVAQRLDHLFDSSDSQVQEKASPFLSPMDKPAEETSTWTPMPQPVEGTAPAVEAESEARAAGESHYLPVEDVLQPQQEDSVTGEDIANRLDALFEESATESSVLAKPAFVPPSEPVFLAEPAPMEAKPLQPVDWGMGEANTVIMPAMSMEEDVFEARETMILSADAIFSPAENQVLPNDAVIPELSLDEVPFFNSETVETVDLKPSSEAFLFASEAALAPENLGLPDVDGDDVGRRLDDIFGIEAGASGKTQGLSPEIQVEAEAMETMETALAISPDLAFESPMAGETVVSGDDITSRLAEIFGDHDGVKAPAGLIDLGMDDQARVTRLEPSDSAMVTQGDEIKADSPAFLALEEEDGPEEDETFEPPTTSIATVTLAEIYFNQGLKEQALQIYRQLQEREPDNESVRRRILEIEASRADGDDKGSGPDDSRPRPGLKIPRRKK